LRSVLTGERVALNFMCHCSGVATLTRRYVRAARGKARILDTRKTLPGLRAVQRAAVRAGGGFNHRDSLSTAVLIKDNHLAALGLTKAVDRARARWPMRLVEVECDTLDQVGEARDAGVDVVLLDNMTPDQVAKAVEILEGAAKVEVSGRVGVDAVGAYAESGADFISVGALTHSVRVFDIGLDIR
jgi:nicotinate-nucleotide pyrophosphorylase (carboxylating)